MITENGTVVALKDDRVWVQTIRQSACESCSARSGCGQRVLASATGGRANQVLVENTVRAQVGDEVTIGIDEQALLGASLIVYALPLLLMVLASIVGHQLSGGSDPGAILGAVVGLLSGFLLSRRMQARKEGQFEPRLLRVNRIVSEACT
ncbi:SoxR reducing system RseC family protein [Marinobacter sp. M216]|uniref:SoxR reducing system RseC family protein n=1 Tax=Marinobacter albus TaxID=3030833 RepID=A0ABT7HG00_9GAMM|nr:MULTISPECIES: SoxR reducing system RseC family protein [unclassified Marinobacter]MBW7472752.1 SoxR reducing system RseC family protein [Marinobacter sp. F4218]MDK9559305.1 SoxR reducing system RseC family protein [Marinobacter sp. M216]